ncbi:hypothetical protein E4U33_000725 [Claviceps sp. LM78 group G4]|nr:hypothetical protein E4U33_000725 [Claviceps sp. LM78 group G4]
MANILSILIAFAALAVTSPVAHVVSCKPDIFYCGHTLQGYNYPGAQSLEQDALYRCQSDGSVKKLEACPGGCFDLGDGKPDICAFIE